ncbi:MAG TPA: ABC transporter permease [Thermoanaerobaculia bacterium]|jgi:putative ABC transport system permease protein|nr:ABC transporter permease [Thermoanaerobaculia bacterium]
MSTARLVKHSFKAVARYKLRSGFMMLGSLVGVAALTLVVSVGEGAERKIVSTVHQLFGGSSILIFSGGGRFMGGPRAGAARMTLDDMEAVVKELPEIEVWDPQQGLFGEPVRYGDASTTARVLGQSERSERVWNRSVTRGEYFDAAAVAGSARVALIGETVARDLFADEDPIGAEILIGSVRFRVIGLLEPFGTDAHGMDRDNEVVVPISTLMRRVMNVDTIQGAKLLVKDPSLVRETAREIKRILRERHSLGSGQPDDFTVITAVQVQQMVRKVERVLFVFLPLVAAVSLVVGCVVAASLMLASVNERVGEIGLRRAIGARPGDIQLQFVLETAVTTLGGGFVGLLVGCAGAELVARRMALGEILSWKAILLGIAAAAVTGLLAGVVPARRAARLQPAEALR